MIYLLDCQKCGSQYVGKSETPFNIRLNNHRKDVNNVQATLSVSKHFREANHSFNRDAKFTLIKQIKNQTLSQKDMRKTLEDHEDLWILKLCTLRPNRLSDELNHPENAVGMTFTRPIRPVARFQALSHITIFVHLLVMCHAIL